MASFQAAELGWLSNSSAMRRLSGMSSEPAEISAL
jgi:hypothetical protein